MLSSYFSDAHPEGTTVDGIVWRHNVSETYSTISSSAGNAYTDSIDYTQIRLTASTTTNQYTRNARGYASFDTGNLVGTEVFDAELRLTPYTAITQNLGATTLDIVAVNTPATTSLSSSLVYQAYDTAVLGSVPLSSLTSGVQVAIPLDVAAINKTGLTRLGIIFGYENGTPPVWSSGALTTLQFYSAEAGSNTPELVVDHNTAYNTSPSGYIEAYGSMDMHADVTQELSGIIELYGSMAVHKTVQPVAGKDYVYKVYDKNDNYIGIWPDVKSEIAWGQRINTPGANTVVELGRSAERRVETRSTRFTQDDEIRLTQDGIERDVVSVSNSSIGEGTDVDLNYNVDVYVHYGTFDTRETQDGQIRITEASEERTVQVGAPLGRRIFSGYILDYEAEYGQDTGVTVTLVSHGAEWADAPIEDGDSTTVVYDSVEIADIAKSILDNDPGIMSYSSDSIEDTGALVDQTFRLNSKMEGIEALFKQSPSDNYWYGGVGDRRLHLHQRSSTADHIFVLGKHIQTLKLKRTLEGLKNKLYFVGGDTGGGTILYKEYEDTASRDTWRRGLERRTDRRVTTTSYTDNYKDNLFDQYSEPIYTTNLRIAAEVYDIESIRLGQTAGFRNCDNFADSLVLQIVDYNYTPYYVDLVVGGVLESQNNMLNKVQEDIQEEQFIDIPDTPS